MDFLFRCTIFIESAKHWFEIPHGRCFHSDLIMCHEFFNTNEFFKINTITHRSSRSAEPNARQNLNARSIIFVVHSIKIINLDGWLWSYSFIFSIIQSLLRVYVFVVVLLRSRGTHISYGRTVPHFQTTPGDVIELYFSLSSSWLCSFCWLRCTVMFLLIQCSCMATGEILNGRIKSL